MSGFIEELQVLINHPHTEISAQSNDGSTALMLLCDANFPPALDQLASKAFAQLLLRTKTQIRNRKGVTALHNAASRGRYRWCEKLLEEGAPINAVNLQKESALHCAARTGQMKTLIFLIEKGADVCLYSPSSGLALDVIMERREMRQSLKTEEDDKDFFL